MLEADSALGVSSPLSAPTPNPKKTNQEDTAVAYLASARLAVEEDNLLHK